VEEMFSHYGGTQVQKPHFTSFHEMEKMATTWCGLWEYANIFFKQLFEQNPQNTSEVNKLIVCGYLQDFLHEYELERERLQKEKPVGE
jgi:hypothetical protein